MPDPTPTFPRLVSENEYSALRGEIGFWQNLRLGVLGFDFAFLGGALGSEALTTHSPFGTPAFMMVVLALSALLIFHGARSSISLGTYLQVFYEETGGLPGWQSRSIRRKGSRFDRLTQYSNLLVYSMVVIALASFAPVVRAIPQMTQPAVAPPDAPEGKTPAGKEQAEKSWTFKWYDGLLVGAVAVFTAAFVVGLVFILRATSLYRESFLAQWRKIRDEEGHVLPPHQYRLNGTTFEPPPK
jgi:hypothetical protein